MSTERTADRTASDHANTGASAWRAAVHAQLAAEPDHSDFYVLAAHLIDSLASARSLSGVLQQQVERYGTGRGLYDDSGTVDPRERLELALLELEEVGVALDETLQYLNRFQSAIGHIGVRHGAR